MIQCYLIILKTILFYLHQISAKSDKNYDFQTRLPLKTLSYEQTQDFQDDKSTIEALKHIAYDLRNYKFNEWDRRYYQSRPKENLVGFFRGFPVPSLEPLHWEVYENCDDSFIKCIAYLKTVINAASDACVKMEMNTKMKKYINETLIENETENYIKNNLEDSCLQFSNSIERFEWKTTASYYMCWYTMLGIPALSMLSEPCDNFADTLDSTYIDRNFDPRSSNKLSFACAVYSFCPDPCCPKKYIFSYDECKVDKINPCFIENTFNNLNNKCEMKREHNQNLNGIIANKWNITCSCKDNGFTWSSKYGMCVDVNECAKEKHFCDTFSENCLNSPGSYYCICKSGFSFNHTTKKCMKINLVQK